MSKSCRNNNIYQSVLRARYVIIYHLFFMKYYSIYIFIEKAMYSLDDKNNQPTLVRISLRLVF